MSEKSPYLMNDCMCGNCKNCWNHLAKLERNKTLADIEKIIDKWVTGHKTSWKYMKRKGFPEAEDYGDCIFLDLKVFGAKPSIDELKEEIKNLKDNSQGTKLDSVKADNSRHESSASSVSVRRDKHPDTHSKDPHCGQWYNDDCKIGRCKNCKSQEDKE